MGLPDSVSWYQKKIGTYDKQQWEKTVEQRILHGLNHVLKKTAKLKTDLIDVDLVRGSSFPKAKPKHGLLTVTKLATIRWLLLPLYSTWWIQQTCSSVFCLLLVLYLLQFCNMIVYFYIDEQYIEHVSAFEVVIPAAMMFILSIIQSQIVSTNSSGAQDSVKGRSRRPKRSKRRRHYPLECKSSTTSTSMQSNSGLCYLNTPGKRLQGKREPSTRRNVAWGTTPLPGNDAEEEAVVSKTEDDGFVSLNSNGSSDGSAEQERRSKGAASTREAEEPSEPSPLSTSERDAWVREVLNKREDSTSPVLCRRQSAPGLCLSCETCEHETDHKDTDSDCSERKVRTKKSRESPQRLLQRRRGSINLQATTSYHSSCESDADEADRCDGPHLTEGTTSAAEWIGITTNSEECSVTSEVDESDGGIASKAAILEDHPFAWEFQLSPTSIMSPSCAASDRVSCTIWESREVKRADLSVLDISSAIIARVETMPENMDYFYAGLCMSVVIALLPSLCRLVGEMTAHAGPQALLVEPALSLTAVDLTADGVLQRLYDYMAVFLDLAFGTSLLERLVIMAALVERFALASLFFFLMAVAERTFKQRFLYAKLFSRLTSFRRARKSELPHFRLNKVRNIKTWLSVRSYLKKRGPQRSVDVIVSAAFIITLLLLTFLSVEMLKDSVRLHSEYNIEALAWSLVLGVYLLRFMTLGNKTNRKYSNLSVLLTEQINLYLQIEQKPNKKEELMVANSVLKLAADLLKELECPFKISGLSANPYVYTITKVVILSALSGVLSEMLGFKLKLHKIKIK